MSQDLPVLKKGSFYFIKDSEIIIQKLMKIPTMRALEKRHLQALLEMSEIKEFEPGEQILEEGQFERSIFYLISGKARIMKNEKEIAIIQRTGDVFGEMGVIDGSARSASASSVSARSRSRRPRASRGVPLLTEVPPRPARSTKHRTTRSARRRCPPTHCRRGFPSSSNNSCSPPCPLTGTGFPNWGTSCGPGPTGG